MNKKRLLLTMGQVMIGAIFTLILAFQLWKYDMKVISIILISTAICQYIFIFKKTLSSPKKRK